MKLKQEIIDKVKDSESRKRIITNVPGMGDQWLIKLLKENRDNGRLTKMDVLTAISEETGVPVTELLESEQVTQE